MHALKRVRPTRMELEDEEEKKRFNCCLKPALGAHVKASLGQLHVALPLRR
jgi:hypothetical protein